MVGIIRWDIGLLTISRSFLISAGTTGCNIRLGRSGCGCRWWWFGSWNGMTTAVVITKATLVIVKVEIPCLFFNLLFTIKFTKCREWANTTT
jgi:hypothetical protein